MCRRTSACVVVVGAILGAGGVAAADEQAPEAVHIDYAAPGECPAGPEVETLIAERTSRFRSVDEAQATRTFAIAIETTPAGFEGRLSVRDAQGSRPVRVITGAACRDITDAVALIVALAIDPRALLAPAKPSAPAPAPAPPPPTIAPAPADHASSTDSAESRAPWDAYAALQTRMTGALAPVPVFGAMASAEIEPRVRAVLAPAFRLGAQGGLAKTVDTRRGAAHFWWAAASAAICPIAIGVGDRVVLRPCVAADAGKESVSGDQTADARNVSPLWLDIGAIGRLQWKIGDALRVEAEGGAILPLVRNIFFFDPDTTVHHVPFVGYAAGIGLAGRVL
jgi:hypothetical protein